MNDIIIRVAGIAQPAPGKQKGSITDHTGKKWGAWPELLKTVMINQTYKVNRYDTNEYMGRTYYTLKDLVMVTNANEPNQTQGNYNINNNTPQLNSGGVSPHRAFGMDDGQRRLDIFVCGAFNNIMANPNINPSALQMMDMIDILHKLRSAWMGVFGPSPLPRQVNRPDPISSGPQDAGNVNDRIPF